MPLSKEELNSLFEEQKARENAVLPDLFLSDDTLKFLDIEKLLSPYLTKKLRLYKNDGKFYIAVDSLHGLYVSVSALRKML